MNLNYNNYPIIIVILTLVMIQNKPLNFYPYPISMRNRKKIQNMSKYFHKLIVAIKAIINWSFISLPTQSIKTKKSITSNLPNK